MTKAYLIKWKIFNCLKLIISSNKNVLIFTLTDINKTLDLIDFFIGKGLASTTVSCDSCYDLSSDHFPIISHLEKYIKRNAPPCYFPNAKTDWLLFQNFVEDTIDTNVILTSKN